MIATTKNNSAVIAVERSDNQKLSHDRSVSTTWVSQKSCPTDCPLQNAGCYAENFLMGKITQRLNASTTSNPTELSYLEADAIDTLTGKRPLRLHVVGDVTTSKGLVALASACLRYIGRFGQTVWAYTHAWKALPRALWGEISILASCHAIAEAQEAHKRGYAAALIVKKFKSVDGTVPVSYKISEDLTGIPCQKQTNRKRDCVSCRLCWHSSGLHSKGQVILFETHGVRKFTVNKTLEPREEF